MAMFIDAAGINLSSIYRPLNNIFLNKIMENIRLKYICKNQIKKGKGGTREILNFLKKNFSIALMIDQRVTEGIKSNLFNRSALTTTKPAQLVKKYSFDGVFHFAAESHVDRSIDGPETFINTNIFY